MRDTALRNCVRSSEILQLGSSELPSSDLCPLGPGAVRQVAWAILVLASGAASHKVRVNVNTTDATTKPVLAATALFGLLPAQNTQYIYTYTRRVLP